MTLGAAQKGSGFAVCLYDGGGERVFGVYRRLQFRV